MHDYETVGIEETLDLFGLTYEEFIAACEELDSDEFNKIF